MITNPVLCLGASVGGLRVCFVEAEPQSPLAAFPTLRYEGQPFNHWLTDEILVEALRHWAHGTGGVTTVAADVERAGARACRAFAALLPVAGSAGDSALLAALAVTGNLVRSLSLLGEAISADRVSAPIPRLLSREWCGLLPEWETDPQRDSRGLGSKSMPRPEGKEWRELADALGKSPTALAAVWDETLATLREEVRQNGTYRASDLRNLQTARLRRTTKTNPASSD